MSRRGRSLVFVLAVLTSACAQLNQLGLLQPPRFEEAPDRPAEIRLLAPSRELPSGGAGVRLWTRITNPNRFGVRLGTLSGTLFLQDSRAATADFPLGLSLPAAGETVIPLDLNISFADLPGLADTVRRAVSRQAIPYHLDGTIGLDGGPAQGATFGPMTLLRGEIAPR
jgi:hypothetical protein